MEKIKFKSVIFEKIWQGLVALFCISIFVSKSGLSIFGSLLILISLFLIPWKDVVKKRKEILIFVSLYPLAIICNFFSLGGLGSSLKVAASWPWVLLALPALVVFLRPRDQKIALVSGIFGFTVACFLSFYYFFHNYDGIFAPNVRVPSFWDISRWGLYLASSLIALIALTKLFRDKKERRLFYLMQSLLVIGAASLLLSNTRAPWLAAAIGIFVFFCLYPRMLKSFRAYVVILILCFALVPALRARVSSMFEVQTTADGKITSTDGSNAGRLHMWQVAMDFYKEQPWFGTGFENTEEHLRAYLDQRGEEYKAKYVTSEYSYRDQHSAYFSNLVQMGILFSVVFWGVLAYLFVGFVRIWLLNRSLWAGTMIALMVCHGVLFVFYSSNNSFDMVALFPFIALFPTRDYRIS